MTLGEVATGVAENLSYGFWRLVKSTGAPPPAQHVARLAPAAALDSTNPSALRPCACTDGPAHPPQARPPG